MREALNGRPSNLSVPPRDPCEDDLNVQSVVRGPLAKQWESLERLDLCCANLGAADIRHLRDGQCPHLRSLNLSKSRLDEAAIEQMMLGQCPLLEELSLGDVSRAVLPSIKDLQNGNWPLLKSLDLCNMDLAFEHVPDLISAAWPLLSHIGLSNNRLQCQALKQLATSWPQLTSLDLSGNSIGVDGVRVLVQSHWSGLQRLALGRCALADAALLMLVKGKWLQLVSLDLQRNNLSCSMMDCLAKASWPALREFNLCLPSAARHEGMPQSLLGLFSKLGALDFGNHYLSHKALQQLGQMLWPHLKSMGLANCLGGSKDIEFLSTVTWPVIESLDLSNNRLPKELIAVLSRPQFLQLKQLFLDQTQMGDCDREHAHLALPFEPESAACPLALFQCPFLETLDVSRNPVINTCMLQLVRMLWPALKKKSMRGIALNVHSLRALFQNGWPALVSLELSSRRLPHVNAMLFPHARPQMRLGQNCWNIEMPWQAQGWLRQLRTLIFSD